MQSKLVALTVVTLILALSAPGMRRAVLDGAGLAPVEATLSAAEPALPSPEPIVRNVGSEVVDTRTMPAVRSALTRLESLVTLRSDPDALRHAFHAYYAYRAANPEQVRKPYLYFVDFGLSASQPRGYVFDMEALTLVEGPFLVAHGRGSVRSGESVPTRFSNTRGSNATSLGLYVAQETYGFSGKSGGRAYRSVGLRLQGVSGRFNSAARVRGIVVHGAPYVTDRTAGRSEGCPAMTQALAQKLLPRIANGGMVFHYSPLDTAWLRSDPWVNSFPGVLASR